MTDAVHAIFFLIGACFLAGSIGASFVFGVALVCRWMEWAPVNTHVDIHYHERTSDLVSTPGDRNDG